jgi:septum formation protein
MKLILASTSPRRSDLLRQAGLEFRVVAPDADESVRKNETPRALVKRLAQDKARSVERKLSRENCLIIAADTIVVSPSGKKILGKPKDPADARRMLAGLQGKTHTVYTGYCLVVRGSKKTFCRVVASRVKLRKLKSSAIEKYVATREPLDKAGSYAAQGIGSAFIDEIRGSYTNVVGLPLSQLLNDLESQFSVTNFSWLKA